MKVGTLLGFSSRSWSKKFARKAVPRRTPEFEVVAPTGAPKEDQSCPGLPAVSVIEEEKKIVTYNDTMIYIKTFDLLKNPYS